MFVSYLCFGRILADAGGTISRVCRSWCPPAELPALSVKFFYLPIWKYIDFKSKSLGIRNSKSETWGMRGGRISGCLKIFPIEMLENVTFRCLDNVRVFFKVFQTFRNTVFFSLLFLIDQCFLASVVLSIAAFSAVTAEPRRTTLSVGSGVCSDSAFRACDPGGWPPGDV